MEPTLKIFVRDSEEQKGLEDARLSVISVHVWEQDGQRHVRLDGEWSDVVQALIDSDTIIVAVNSPNAFPQA